MSPDRDGIEAIAGRQAASVLDEAVTKARQRAVDELADLLTPAMVRQARQLTHEQSEPRSADQEPSSGAVGQYAYAITDAAVLDLHDVTGLRGYPVRLLGQDGLRLVVSEIPLAVFEQLSLDDLTEGSELAELARRHDDVIRAVAEQTTVLPLRFGTVLPDKAAGERLLAERAEQARGQLEEFRAHQEWGVRVLAEPEPAEPAEPAPADPESPQSGTDYLARRRQALDAERDRRQRTRAALSEVSAALAEHASAAVQRDGREGVLLDAAFLVAASEEEAFFAEVRRHAELLAEQRLALDTTGPWPPYSFAGLDAAAAADG